MLNSIFAPGAFAAAILATTLSFAASVAFAESEEEFVVTANKTQQAPLTLIGNTARLRTDEIQLTSHQHIHELGTRVAGTWISRGSGQEHLTAIRSPVLTGAGACGAFLVLENGVPTRPTGFCNVNQLFEIPAELARGVEVIRGPTNALYGSNGLHGTINVLLPWPASVPGFAANLTLGPDRFRRGTLQWAGPAGNFDLASGFIADDYDGLRADSGYAQQKGFVVTTRQWPRSRFKLSVSTSNLNQETAGFVSGANAYRDDQLRTTNPNPEAFRDANSQRLTLQWTPNENHRWFGVDLRAWLRRSDMEFLQHFLPGQPLEQNGQVSTGASAIFRQPLLASSTLTTGIDIEIARGYVEEVQFGSVESSSAFLVETRPAGPHYDFDVLSANVAAYAQWNVPFDEKWTAQFGLRLEYLHYDYDNRLTDGNARADGTSCGFGGCLFRRPADGTDNFLNLAPNIGLLYRPGPATSVFATLSRGFRAPQVTELYRLQNQQSVADLDTVVIDSAELGARWYGSKARIEGIVFVMNKDNFIFRDADGFNVSGGESRHAGVEITANIQMPWGLYSGIAGSWSRQTYRFNRMVAAGETITSGDDVDTAPATLGSARLGFADDRLQTEFEWLHHGSYFLNAANTEKYSGHNLVNFRSQWRWHKRWSIALRINNLLDARYADRADFAFGSFRYFPGRDREWFVQIGYHSPNSVEQ